MFLSFSFSLYKFRQKTRLNASHTLTVCSRPGADSALASNVKQKVISSFPPLIVAVSAGGTIDDRDEAEFLFSDNAKAKDTAACVTRLLFGVAVVTARALIQSSTRRRLPTTTTTQGSSRRKSTWTASSPSSPRRWCEKWPSWTRPTPPSSCASGSTSSGPPRSSARCVALCGLALPARPRHAAPLLTARRISTTELLRRAQEAACSRHGL